MTKPNKKDEAALPGLPPAPKAERVQGVLLEGLTVPKRTGSTGRPSKFDIPFEKMEVNQAVFFAGLTASKLQHTVRGAKKRLAPKNFSCANTTHDGVTGVGVWRTA